MKDDGRKTNAIQHFISKFALVKKFGVANLVISRKPSHGLTKQNQNVTKDGGRKTNTIQHFISNFALVKKIGVANPVISK